MPNSHSKKKYIYISNLNFQKQKINKLINNSHEILKLLDSLKIILSDVFSATFYQSQLYDIKLITTQSPPQKPYFMYLFIFFFSKKSK